MQSLDSKRCDLIESAHCLQYFTIILHLDSDLIFGGTFEPAAFAEISSIGDHRFMTHGGCSAERNALCCSHIPTPTGHRQALT